MRLLVDDISTGLWDRHMLRQRGEPIPDEEEYVPTDVTSRHRVVEVSAQGRSRALAMLALRRSDEGIVRQHLSFELPAEEIGDSGLVMIGLEHPAHAPEWTRQNELEDSLVGVCVARMVVEPLDKPVKPHVLTGRPGVEHTPIAAANPGFFVLNPASDGGPVDVSLAVRGAGGERLQGRRAKVKHPLRYSRELRRGSQGRVADPGGGGGRRPPGGHRPRHHRRGVERAPRVHGPGGDRPGLRPGAQAHRGRADERQLGCPRQDPRRTEQRASRPRRPDRIAGWRRQRQGRTPTHGCRACRDDPQARLALLRRLYEVPAGVDRGYLPYRRAASAFMGWQLRRGLLNPASDQSPGSAWWRAVNESLLRDTCEASALAFGLPGAPRTPGVAATLDFIREPTARAWYRAHNLSIASAYLANEDLARTEGRVERFFINLVLVRVLYAHALVAAAAARPRLAGTRSAG